MPSSVFLLLYYFWFLIGSLFRRACFLWSSLLLCGDHYCFEFNFWCYHRYICWFEEREADSRRSAKEHLLHMWFVMIFSTQKEVVMVVMVGSFISQLGSSYDELTPSWYLNIALPNRSLKFCLPLSWKSSGLAWICNEKILQWSFQWSWVVTNISLYEKFCVIVSVAVLWKVYLHYLTLDQERSFICESEHQNP